MPHVPLTVLHLVSLKGMGGRAATALRQIRLLSERGHRVLVGCLPGTAVETRARALNAAVFTDFEFRRGFRLLPFWRDCRRIAALCNEHHVDVLHAHLSQESWVGCVGARLARQRPAVVRSRGVVVPVKPHLMNRWLHNRLTDALIVPSQAVCGPLSQLPGFDPRKITLLPDGVDVVRFAPLREKSGVRNEFQAEDGCALIVMVARLERVKGHLVFFQALARLAQNPSAPRWRAVCACDERTPGALDAAKRAAHEAGLDERAVVFTGFRSDIEKIIASADMAVLPSLGSEGSSRVGLEGAACGVPVVGSSVGCLPEVIQHERTGLIVPPADSEALAGALLRLLNAPQQAAEMGRAARARAEELYDERVMAQRLEDVYRQALARCGRQP